MLFRSLDAGSYIVMLSGASVENAWQVAGRVEQKFRRAYANSNANITFRMSSLEPLTAQ